MTSAIDPSPPSQDSRLLNIRHVTRYDYDAGPDYGLQQLRLTPLEGPAQSVLEWDVSVSGGTVQAITTDQFGNKVHLVRLEADAQKKAQGLSITSAGRVATRDVNGIMGPHKEIAPLWLYQRTTPRTEPTPAICDLVDGLTGGDTLERLHTLSERIRSRVTYKVGVTDASTTADAAMKLGQGVCQDHSQIFIAAARTLGHPARYVSGYLSMDDQVEQDATHAWAEAYVDGLGWVGFDVSNGIAPDTRYVRIATALDYNGAAPVSGSLRGGANERIGVALHVSQETSQSAQ